MSLRAVSHALVTSKLKSEAPVANERISILLLGPSPASFARARTQLMTAWSLNSTYT